MVKNLPSGAGDAGSIPGRGTKIPHAAGQLGLRTTTTEPECHKLQSPRATTREENLCATTREKPSRCNEEPARCN